MKTPFDNVDRVIINEVEKKKKRNPIKILAYVTASLAAMLSVYFTSVTMIELLPVVIAVAMSVAITLYIDIAAQIAALMLKRSKVLSVALYILTLVPIAFSILTSLKTMYSIQSVKLESQRNDVQAAEVSKEQLEQLRAERQKYEDELLTVKVGSWQEVTIRKRLAEIDQKMGDITDTYKRTDFYTFLASITGLTQDWVEFLFMAFPAIFIDIIAPVILTLTVYM